MTDRSKLLALAGLIGTVERANTDLDAEIAVLLGWSRPMLPGSCGPDYIGRARYEWHDTRRLPRGFKPPAFTSSVDAAATLTDGWFKLEPSPAGWVALGKRGPWCSGATPALALCAAALRAQAEALA